MYNLKTSDEFVKSKDIIFRKDDISYIDCSKIEDLEVKVFLKDGKSFDVHEIHALELVMQIKPSLLEGKKLKWKKFTWITHNLLAHPFFQIFALFKFYKIAFWIHDVTVPKPSKIQSIKKEEIKSCKQVIIMRKDLNMRKGKMISQGGHACINAILDNSIIEKDKIVIPLNEKNRSWFKDKHKKITVSVNSEQELLDIYKQAKSMGLTCALIKDSGLTEFKGVPTYTSVAIGPDEEDIIDKVTGNLPLL